MVLEYLSRNTITKTRALPNYLIACMTELLEWIPTDGRPFSYVSENSPGRYYAEPNTVKKKMVEVLSNHSTNFELAIYFI